MAFAIAALGARARVDHHRAPTSVGRAPTRASSSARVAQRREGGQDLPGRLHGRGQDHARTRARAAARLARRGRRRADRGARAAHRGIDIFAGNGEPYFPRRRARGAPRPAARCATWSSRPAAARSSTRRTARPCSPTAPSSGSTCRSRDLLERIPADGRRPLAADRRAARAAVRARARRLRAGAPAARRHAGPGRSPGRSRSSTALDGNDVRYLVLSDIHANLEALDAVLAAAATRRLRPGARPRRPRRLRRRPERGGGPRAGTCARRRPSAATTTRSPPASSTPRASTSSRGTPSTGRTPR